MLSKCNLLFLVYVIFFTGCGTVKFKPQFTKLQDPFGLNVKYHELDNGLILVVVEDKSLPVYSLQTFFNVGGKNEVAGITGASHLLEHLLFKGTKTKKKENFDYIVEGSGGSSNAYTSNDMTVYFENMPSSTLEKMLQTEADRMVNLAINPVEFESERQVVLEERKMRYENSPRGQLYLTLMQEMFRATPYGTSVIGSVKDLKSVTRDQIYNYYKQWYAPNNATLVIVGDVDFKQTVSWVEKYYGPLKASPTPIEARALLRDEDFEMKRVDTIKKEIKGASPLPMFMLGFAGHPIGTKEGFALDLISSILGDGQSSFLQKKFTLGKKVKASNLYAGNYTLEKAGTFLIGGQLVQGVEPAAFRAELLKALRSSCQTEMNAKNLQKVLNQYLISTFKSLETNAGKASFVGERQAFFRDWSYYKKEWNDYQSIKPEKLREVCQSTLNQKNWVWVSVWDKHKNLMENE
jgi:zinc protease